MLHSLRGFENAEIMRYAYAIEYDCLNPLELYGTLMTKRVAGCSAQVSSTAHPDMRKPPHRGFLPESTPHSAYAEWK